MKPKERHTTPLPSMRKIRRACATELYRTVKRMNVYIPAPLVEQGEQLYVKKVVANLLFVHEHGQNRKKLCDWWDEHVAPELSELWNVDIEKLKQNFRHTFGG
ncbi:dehydrogenase [Paenibacillus arenosi]